MSWRPPAHNVQGREGQWYASFFHSHNCFCGCGDPVGHLNRIAPRFPNARGPPPPPELNQALGPPNPGAPPAILPALPPPANPDDQQPPRRGGTAAEGAAGHGDGADAAADYGEEDLELLFAAADEDQ